MSVALPVAAPSAVIEGRTTIVLSALTATYMQAVNISIPNAALPHMQGALSMATDELGWVFSGYIASSIILLPIARWLALRYGRKRILLISLGFFALGLVFDGLATSTIGFVLARMLQGIASGPIGPLSLAILLDVLPPARHARITLIWTVLIMLGICTGPGIGGWLSEYHGWRSMFFLCLPVVGMIFLAMALSLPEKKAEKTPPFDFFGFATLLLGMVGLQMLLDRGERLEWFSSAEIWIEGCTAALGFYLVIVHVLTSERHFFDKALLKDRNFVIATIMYFGVGFVLLPTLALTSPMLEELLGYPVDTTGYMTIPRGIGLVGLLVLMSFAPARIDNRLFILGGAAIVACANWKMLGYSPQMDWQFVAVAGFLQGAGLGIVMPAIAKLALVTVAPELRPEGTALFNLSRLYGATIGIAVVQIYFYNNTQAVHLALARNITPFRDATHGAAAMSKQTMAGLNEMITGQAAVIATIDQFKILMIVVLAIGPLVLLLRKPSAANKASNPK